MTTFEHTSFSYFIQKSESWMDFFSPMVLAFWSFAVIFLFCELGERLTGRFNEIDNEIFGCDWYTFPADVQKMLPIILIGTQTPVLLNGVGNVQCTREAFKIVNFFELKNVKNFKIQTTV